MSKHQKNRSCTDILADVVAHAYETDALPTDKEAEEYLAANKIDNTELENWGLEKLKAVKSRQKLKAELAELRKDKARLVRAAFTAGYCRGHNDTVEGCVSSPDEWDDAEWSALTAEAIDAAMATEVES